jgi:phosphodiesterase/alkaline phosphatase D-like protein
MPTPPDDRCAPASSLSPDAPDLVAAPLPRRGFLGLALGASAAWLAGCGDDLPDGSGDGSDSSTTGTGSGSSTTNDTLDGSTSTSTSSGSTDESTSDTDAPEACTDDASLVAFDPDAIPQDDAVFPYALMAGEMRTTSALLALQIPDAQPKTLRVWRPADEPGMVHLLHELEVVPDADGYAKLPIEGLCPGTWYRYAYFVGEPASFTARSLVAELRTAPDDDVLEPLTIAISACGGSNMVWPALEKTALEYYDLFIHLGDMAYNDGAFSQQEYRESWRAYLSAPGYRECYARAGLYATWDDHEIDDNGNFDRETMDPQQLLKRQTAMDAYFEVMPIDAQGPDYRLWRSFRWGRTAEIIVLDCRYERRPSLGLYISPEQMAFLQDRLLNSPCHFKIVMNSVPITNMPGVWDLAAFDRWEGYPAQRDALLAFIDENLITNVWFLSGDFHTCFVARIEPSGGLTANTWEIAVTSGNSNPLPDIATGFSDPQFDYGVTVPRGCILLFDPEANAVNVRFIDPDTGEDVYDQTLSQVALDG